MALATVTDNELLYGKAPEPLEIFEKRLVHPDNQAAIARAGLMQKLNPLTRWLLHREMIKLHKWLNEQGYNQLVSEAWEVYRKLKLCNRQYKRLRAELQSLQDKDKPDNYRELVMQWREKKTMGIELLRERERLQAKLHPLIPVNERLIAIDQRLEQHNRIVAYSRETGQRRKRQKKEAKWIRLLMIEALKKAPGCHYHVTVNGRERVVAPLLSKPMIDSHTIYYRLMSSSKTAMGWKNLMPRNVIPRDLTSDDTLELLSLIVGRQVEVRRDLTGTQIYYCVNRLDSPGGLPENVPYMRLMDFYKEKDKHKYIYPLGIQSGGRNLWGDLSKHPHILIAGESGMGKSNQVNCMISTWITKHSTDELRLVLIDNKGGVELSHYHDVPHVLGKVCKTIDTVLPSLEMVNDIMDERKLLLEAKQARNIATYNKRVSPQERLPRIVIIIDEMAVLGGLGRVTREIYRLITILTAQGRAFGIHMVICTQHPKADVVPTQIKVNMGIRITFAMPDGHASATILDTHDAKKLLAIPGRALIKSGMELTEIQVPFITDEKINESIRIAKENAKSKEAAPIPQIAAESKEVMQPNEPVELVGESRSQAPFLTDEEIEGIAHQEKPDSVAPFIKETDKDLGQNEPEKLVGESTAIETPKPVSQSITATTTRKTWNQEIALAIAMELGGILATDPIWKRAGVKKYIVARRQVDATVKAIIDCQEVEIDSQIYDIVREGNRFRLTRQLTEPEFDLAEAI